LTLAIYYRDFLVGQCLKKDKKKRRNLMLRSGAARGCHYVMDEIHSASSIFSFSSHSLSVATFHTTQRMRRRKKIKFLKIWTGVTIYASRGATSEA
jgi:hypothetical protein